MRLLLGCKLPRLVTLVFDGESLTASVGWTTLGVVTLVQRASLLRVSCRMPVMWPPCLVLLQSMPGLRRRMSLDGMFAREVFFVTCLLSHLCYVATESSAVFVSSHPGHKLVLSIRWTDGQRLSRCPARRFPSTMDN